MDDGQKDLLLNVTSAMETGETRFYEQVNTTFRWLMATLWASNGGAMIALIGSRSDWGAADKMPLAWFAVGLVSSLFMGLTNLVYAAQAMKPMSDLKNAFTVAAFTGEFDQAEIEGFQSKLMGTTKFKWPLWSFGIASLACLMIGLLQAGSAL